MSKNHFFGLPKMNVEHAVNHTLLNALDTKNAMLTAIYSALLLTITSYFFQFVAQIVAPASKSILLKIWQHIFNKFFKNKLEQQWVHLLVHEDLSNSMQKNMAYSCTLWYIQKLEPLRTGTVEIESHSQHELVLIGSAGQERIVKVCTCCYVVVVILVGQAWKSNYIWNIQTRCAK